MSKCSHESGDCIANKDVHPKDYCKFCNVKATVHVRIPGEGFWALKTHDPHVVCINNLPLEEGYNLYDMYEYRGGDLGKRIEQGSDTVHAKYTPGENTKETWTEKMAPYFLELQEAGTIVWFCGQIAGFMSIAMEVGKGNDIDLLRRIQDECPVEMSIEPVWRHDNPEDPDHE